MPRRNAVQIPTAGTPGGCQNPYPPGSRRMFHLTDLAYAKIILHALKYPHQTVNGVLLGPTPTRGATISISDAVPLQHHWTNLSPMMEVGLGMVANYAHSNHLHVVGYYEAPARVGDTALSQVGERVVTKIKETFPTPVALVLDGSRLNVQNGAALVPYVTVSSIFRRAQDRLTFNPNLPARVLHLTRRSNILDQFWDFDDYLENTRLPFLTNSAVQRALNSLQ
ncbi:hypothetical protein BC827DRAFT_1267441 [Russula dissimulans]|nr:hypothetical protein BC827DRAFT_1267441 [Russula dissimulans]